MPTNKTALIYRHLAFEDAGLLGIALESRGYTLDYRDVGVDNLDGGLEADLLIILGGPIGVHDVKDYPYLAEELDIIAKRHEAGGATIGICLGAQLGAVALGGSVVPGSEMELGWSPLQPGDGALADILCALPVLHWHKDQIRVEGIADATVAASTAICPVQAFTAGRFLGLQFHLEAEPAKFERWLIGHTDCLRDNNIDIPALRAATKENAAAAEKAVDKLLDAWL
ncbi:MAG: glutamine amidotransferase [Corynebacterium sp.]|nr:glutamine amidotransferase [Corynebacterium sp.]